jgi:hypothetical protein
MNRFFSALVRRPQASALTVLVLVSLVFRVYVSHACSLWLDEDYTHVEIGRSWPVVLAGPEPAHPPLFFILTKLATLPFGYSETALRATSFAAGCVLLVAVYWLCLELELTAWRSLAVVALLAITPFFMNQAIEARMYALYSALAALAVVCMLRLLREPRRLGYLLGFALCVGAMAATHYFGLAYAFALLGALASGMIPRWRQVELTPRRGLCVAVVLAALVGVLAAVLLRAVALASFYSKTKSGGGSGPWQELLDQILREFSFIGASDAAAKVELALTAAGLVLLARSLRGIARIVPLALAFCPCIGALFITSGHFVAPRYMAPSWIFFHIGACVALFALVDAVRRVLATRASKLGLSLACALVLVPVAWRLAEYPTRWGTGESDYRGLQRYFMEHLAPNTALVTFPGHAGIRMMQWEYPVNTRPIELEHFKRVPGIDRYLVAEIHLRGPARRLEFEHLIRRNFGLAPAVWRDLPLLDLPGTTFQPPVQARLLVWDGDKVTVPAARPRPRPAPRRHHHRRSEHEDLEG